MKGFAKVRQTGKLPPAHFYLGWRRTDVERRPTAVRRRSAVPTSFCGSSAAPKQKAFDRGGPVWPPRSNAKDGRSGGSPGGLCLRSQKSGGLAGSGPPAKTF